MKFSVDTTPKAPSGCGSFAGKGFGTIFFGVFFLMGALFTFFMLAETWKQAEPWLWSATDCTILSSGVTETGPDQNPYRPQVRYRYEVDGQIHESDRFFRSGGNTASFDLARDRAARYQPGDAATSSPAAAVSPGSAAVPIRAPAGTRSGPSTRTCPSSVPRSARAWSPRPVSLRVSAGTWHSSSTAR